MLPATRDFHEQYIDQIFYLWYQNNRTTNPALIVALPEDEFGRKPNIGTVKRWVTDKGWIERADALDAETSRQLDKQVIDARIEMFKKHEEVGKALVEKGLEYLQTEEFKDMPAALRAIDLGVEIERMSVGLAQSLLRISEMSNDQLDKELKKMLGTKSSVDADYIEEA